MNLLLIGYRGTGKSAVAQQLGLALGWDWVDADVELELRAGRSIAAIFAADGEAAFRDLESAVLADLVRRERSVIALGGGVVLRSENQRLLRDGGKVGGKVVWLTADPDTIHRRLTEDPVSLARRPPLTAAGGLDEIRQLLAHRTPLYQQCAELVVDTVAKTPAEVAAEILRQLPQHGEPRVNLILSIPFEVRLAILVMLGACLGSLINFCVVRLEYEPRSVSPWSASLPGAQRNALPEPLARRWTDRLPIFGWFGMRRESPPRNNGFWIRPLVIELACAVGLPALYAWEVGSSSSQLLPQALQTVLALPANAAQRRAALVTLHCVFLSHVCLSVLMIVASLIDLDEGLIPDEITVPGTLLGLLLAAVLPGVLLPVMATVNVPAAPFLAQHTLEFLTFPAPRDWPWPGELMNVPDVWSLVAGLACLWLWCFALLPRSWRSRHGLRRALAIFWTRLARETLTYWVLAIGAVASVGTVLVWRVGGDHWRALLSSWVGLAAGGGLIWAVRILGTRLLGREAMGFGDVTLLAMIGAFLGWQPCLVIFLLAPLAGAVVGAIQWLLSRESEIRYGPFLCLATWVTIFRWPAIWDGIREMFLVPWLVPAALLVCLLLMVPLLWLVRFVGDRLRGEH